MKRFCLEIIISLFLILNFTSCNNDIDIFNLSDEVKLDQALVIPIGATNATTVDILKRLRNSQDWIVDSLSDEIYFEKFDTVIYKYKDIDLAQKIFPLPIEYPLNTDLIPKILTANSSGVVNQNSSLNTSVNNDIANERLDSIYVNSMTLSCNLSMQNVPFPASAIKVKIIIPRQYLKFANSTNDTITFSPISYNVDNDVVLTNVKLSFPNAISNIPIKTEIYYNTGGNSYILFPNSKIFATFSIKNLEYKVAYGYFNPGNYKNPTETNSLDYFSHLPEGYLRFANPQVFMKSYTNIGSHLLFRFDYVRAYLTTDPNYTPIYASFDGNRSFTQSLSKPNKPGDYKETQMKTFDKDFGHTNLLFDNVKRPNIFEYQFTSMLDDGKIKTDPTPDYLVPNSQINLFIYSKLALYFNEGSFYETIDTIEINDQIDATLNNDLKIDTCYIVLNVTNAFPCQAIAKLQMYDQNNKPILTDLVKDYTILSGSVDENGTVIKGKEKNQIIKILVKQPYLEELKTLKYIISNIKITGENGTQGKKKIHLTQNDNIDVKIGLYVKFNSVIKLK